MNLVGESERSGYWLRLGDWEERMNYSHIFILTPDYGQVGILELFLEVDSECEILLVLLLLLDLAPSIHSPQLPHCQIAAERGVTSPTCANSNSHF